MIKKSKNEPCVHHTCRHISHRNIDWSHPEFLAQQMLARPPPAMSNIGLTVTV